MMKKQYWPFKKKGGTSYVIDAIEETDSAYWHAVAFVLIFFIDEGRDSTQQLTFLVDKNPTDRSTCFEQVILFVIKYTPDVSVKRTYPIGIVFIALDVDSEKFPFIPPIFYFVQ